MGGMQPEALIKNGPSLLSLSRLQQECGHQGMPMTVAAVWQGAKGCPGIGGGLGLQAELEVQGDHLNMQGLILRGPLESLEQAGSSLIHPAQGCE